MLQLIIFLYIFNSLIWLTGLAKVVSTCSRQPKLIARDNNDLYHFFTFYLDAGMHLVLGFLNTAILMHD